MVNSKKFKRLCLEFEERQKKREERGTVCVCCAVHAKEKKGKAKFHGKKILVSA